MVAIRWCGALLWSLLGCSVEAGAKGWMSRLLKVDWNLGEPHSRSFPTTWPQARDVRVPALMLTDLPPEPEHEPPALERPGQKEPLVVREHEDIVLTATLATPSVAAVTWFKDGVEIRRSKRHETASLGDTHTLTVRGAQTLDSAVYSCRVGAKGQDFPVQVEGQWPAHSPLGTPHLLVSREGVKAVFGRGSGWGSAVQSRSP